MEARIEKNCSMTMILLSGVKMARLRLIKWSICRKTISMSRLIRPLLAKRKREESLFQLISSTQEMVITLTKIMTRMVHSCWEDKINIWWWWQTKVHTQVLRSSRCRRSTPIKSVWLASHKKLWRKFKSSRMQRLIIMTWSRILWLDLHKTRAILQMSIWIQSKTLFEEVLWRAS